jgi:hypothetical protein
MLDLKAFAVQRTQQRVGNGRFVFRQQDAARHVGRVRAFAGAPMVVGR